MSPAALPERLLLGPGPSNVPERVRQALAQPLVGHLDPAFLQLLDELQGMLRSLFRTSNERTLPLSGTGSAGMEACLVNLLEPGETAVIAVCGVFGQRMSEVVERAGAKAVRVEAPMGEAVPPEQLCDAIDAHRPRLVALVHAETSTGVAQPVEAVAAHARHAGALVVLDCVTSLSGMDVRIDDWQVDAAYSGTQKCLSCPPGLAPVSFGPRALERIEQRHTPVQSWYLDVGLLGAYFGGERVYHHTAPVSMIMGLHEALRCVLEEGLEARFARHREAHERLVTGLSELGFEMLVEPERRLPMLNAVVPPYDDEASARRRLLEQFGIEVGGGLGALAGRIWRIGLMGHNARAEVVDRLLEALREIAA
jgi:alanine-glyoxylate transaminase/serine-glyoxylate transaminase/serine-pyruvate transaminase